MAADVERRALRRTAARVGADVGPVAPVLNPECLGHRDSCLGRTLAQRGGDRRDLRVCAVAHREHSPDALGRQEAHRVPGEGGGHPGLARVGHVVAERDPNLAVARLGADYHDAAPWVETKKARDDRDQGRRRADTYPQLRDARVQRVSGDAGHLT